MPKKTEIIGTFTPEKKAGGRSVTTNEPFHSHDFIELSPRTQARIFEKCAPLYENGCSIRDIAAQTPPILGKLVPGF